MFEDCELLSRIIDRDRAFADVGFSTEKIASFMETVFEQEPSFMKDAAQNDAEARERAIDDHRRCRKNDVGVVRDPVHRGFGALG
jgi:hypothetical protein